MREELNRLCSQFIRNQDMVKSTFGWENTYMYPVSAAIFTDKRMDAEADKLLWCRDILKENTGIFSQFAYNLTSALSERAILVIYVVDPSTVDQPKNV